MAENTYDQTGISILIKVTHARDVFREFGDILLVDANGIRPSKIRPSRQNLR